MFGDDELRVIPIHRSLTRPQLMMGCERFLCLMLLMVVTLLTFGALVLGSFINFIAAVFIYVVGKITLGKMAKYDAQMSAVYRRSVLYRHYYPAITTVGWRTKIKPKRW